MYLGAVLQHLEHVVALDLQDIFLKGTDFTNATLKLYVQEAVERI